jgi:hypothetical protein
MAEMQNANPTILNTTDLPTRQRKSPKAKNALVAGQEYYEGTVFYNDLALPELTDPFALRSSYSSGESESDDNDNDENVYEEPIDEQEIYGTSPLFNRKIPHTDRNIQTSSQQSPTPNTRYPSAPSPSSLYLISPSHLLYPPTHPRRSAPSPSSSHPQSHTAV